MRALMGNNLPPRFKFKDTYDSIEVPTTHQQHLPSQATLEAKFDEAVDYRFLKEWFVNPLFNYRASEHNLIQVVKF